MISTFRYATRTIGLLFATVAFHPTLNAEVIEVACDELNNKLPELQAKINQGASLKFPETCPHPSWEQPYHADHLASTYEVLGVPGGVVCDSSFGYSPKDKIYGLVNGFYDAIQPMYYFPTTALSKALSDPDNPLSLAPDYDNYFKNHYQYQTNITKDNYQRYQETKKAFITGHMSFLMDQHGLSRENAELAAFATEREFAKIAYSEFFFSDNDDRMSVNPYAELLKGADSLALVRLFQKDARKIRFDWEYRHNLIRQALIQGINITPVKPYITAKDLIYWGDIPRAETPVASLAADHFRNLNTLLKLGVNPNQPNKFGKTAIFYAVQNSNYMSVLTLLSKLKNKNIEYERQTMTICGYPTGGRNLLHHAAQHSDLRMLKILLDANVNPNAIDEDGNTLLDYALRNNTESRDKVIAYIQDTLNIQAAPQGNPS